MATLIDRPLDPSKLREARERADMTQVDLAVAAKVSPATVHRIEAGRQRPRFRIVVRLARALDVDEGDLLHSSDGTPAVAPCGESSDTEARRPTLASVEGETGSKQEGA